MEKIAVLRANGIGDLVFALPALESLRAAHRSAEIVLLGLEWHADFLQGRPGPVDRVEVVPPDGAVRTDGDADPRASDAFIQRMREERFDAAVQMHGGGRESNPFVSSLGARLTVGLRSREAPRLDLTVPYRLYQPEVQRYLEVAGLLGADATYREPRIEVTAEDRRELSALHSFGRLSGAGVSRLAALNPGAGDPRRRWPPVRFAEVGDALARQGFNVVVTGSLVDGGLAARVVDSMREPGLDLSGRLSLGGLCALFERCAVVVSNDSGPLHVAAACGAPTAGIFWCGNLITAGLPTRSRHRYAISWRLECPRCGARCMLDDCGHDDSFVTDVPVREVLAEALELARTASEGVTRSAGVRDFVPR